MSMSRVRSDERLISSMNNVEIERLGVQPHKVKYKAACCITQGNLLTKMFVFFLDNHTLKTNCFCSSESSVTECFQ